MSHSKGKNADKEPEVQHNDSSDDYGLEELRVLGRGGQASVSLCRDTATGELLALKTSHIARSKRPQEGLEGSVQEEARATDQLFDLRREYETMKFLMDSQVQGVVAARGMCMDDSTEQLCILMDYCDGGSLLSELHSRPSQRLSERQAAAVLSSLAHTLEQCHKLGIMHRDIKPENVLIQQSTDLAHHRNTRKRSIHAVDDDSTEDSISSDHEARLDGCRFLLADFGLASRFTPGHRIKDRYLVGTNGYMAPEMMKGAYDERADVWSLGALLHLILTGHLPFEQQQQQQASVRQHRVTDESAILSWTSPCPRKLDVDSSNPMYEHLSWGARSMLHEMLRKKPRQRISLSAIRSHPWLQPSYHESSRRHHNAAAVPTVPGVKRIRLINLPLVK